MQHVELVDGSEPVPRTPAPRARLWVHITGAAVALVGVLAAAQTVLDARERAAEERLVATPGIVRTVDVDVGVLWRPDVAATAVLPQGIEADGALLGLAVFADGSQTFVSLDQRTGEQRFATPLMGADPARATSLDRSAAGTCVAVPVEQGPPLWAACLVSDGFVQFGDEGVQSRQPATTTRVVVLDTRDGHVVADTSAPGATTIAALPGLAVVGVPGTGAHAQVVGRDLVTGEVRWRFTPPLPGADRRAFAGQVRVFAVGGLVGVTIPGWSATVLSSTGEVLRASRPGDADLLVDRVAGRFLLLSATGSGGLRSTLVVRGRPDVDLPGSVLPLTVDDGTVPGLVLTAGGKVRGWDAATGRQRWTSDVVASVNALVLHGRVYVSTRAGVVALEGRTGDIDWQAETAQGTVPGYLATDGHRLVIIDQPASGGPRSDLVAYRLDDGRTQWRVPFPGGLRSSVTVVGHLLLGWGDDGRPVVLG